MALDTYRDLSTGGTDITAGFQFEFCCAVCSRKWKSPFKPHRMGQFTGLLSRFSFLLGSGAMKSSRVTGTMADYGSRTAKQQALDEAKRLASQRYANCANCDNVCCQDCLDGDGVCTLCLSKGRKSGGASETPGAPGGHACPNCATPGNGGRFCAECGFDMASTHKSCPGCGALAERAARFCGDCGHGF